MNKFTNGHRRFFMDRRMIFILNDARVKLKVVGLAIIKYNYEVIDKSLRK
ncbi:hypothetical protein [Staphylococcus epidermidis]|nr:hypothetical protein [Staphylococcus epidermidis]MCO6263289.1 hypothetical protein [Staphylococcus epidermidis]